MHTREMIPLVELPQFEGPLELLLYLIKKEEIDIYDIPISHVTERYLQALKHYHELNLDVAGEFLVMASTLMFIKSKMLLPLEPLEEETEEGRDPRAELVRQLLEFQMYQEAADDLKHRELLGWDVFHIPKESEAGDLLVLAQEDQPLAPISLFELIKRFKSCVDRAKGAVHTMSAEEVPLRKCIEIIVERLEEKPLIHFSELIKSRWSLRELIVFFLGVLELCRMKYLCIEQSEPYGPIVLARHPDKSALDLSQLSWI